MKKSSLLTIGDRGQVLRYVYREPVDFEIKGTDLSGFVLVDFQNRAIKATPISFIYAKVMPFIHFRYPSKANLAPKYRTFGNLPRLDHCLTTCNIGIWSPQGERGMGESVAQGKDELEVNVNQRIFHNTCAPFHLLFP